MYVPLWCKTNFSFLEGASHPEELIETAARLGLPAIAITDRNGVYGMVRAFDAARRCKVALITGSQVSIDDGSSVILLAQDRAGYGNLCRLVSRGHLRNPKGTCSVSWTEVAESAQGLVALWPNDPANPSLRDRGLGMLKEAYGDRLYAIVSRHRWVDDVARERTSRESAARFSLPLVAATEVLYHVADRRRLQDVLVCIRRGTTLREAGTQLYPNAEHALKTAAELEALYGGSPGLVEASREVADRCRFSFEELVYKYPDEVVPDGFTTATWLRHIAFEGAKNRYRDAIPESARALLEKELALIDELGYCGYFLTMWELVRFCRERDIICQGRGSAANSVVCYCLGVTSVDPVRMNLLFERFLSRERAEPPDIDLDIEHNRREEVIQHMYEKYGRDRAAMVANVVRYRTRSAIREVGKAFGIPEIALDHCAKLLPHWQGDLDVVFREAGLDLPPHMRGHMVELTKEIVGFPRHLSIHPGGFLLGSDPVDTIVPIENATMQDRTVIQWDKTDIETMNLFKVDLLGLGALTHLDYAFRLLKTHYDTELSLATIPPDDAGVFDMACRADTVGVFQIESRAQMAMLPRLKPRSYYDLVIEVSLVRPGPITGGMVHPYLRRRAGKEKVTYPHPSLEPVLSKTLGIPLFQEQVMKLAVVAADYTPGEADQLRRDMAAWKQRGRIELHHDRLVSRMVAKGIEPEFAERVFGQILGFGEYGFPESHAASFALIAYATAYIKHHYPAVFACALLNAWPFGFYSPATVIDDSKRHKVRFLPIDILQSHWDCTMEREVGAGAGSARGRPFDEHAVRIGLRYVKGLGKGDWERILAWRGSGRTSTLSDFTSACRLPRDSMERLAEVGAFDCFDKERRGALWGVLDQSEHPTTLLVGDLEETPRFRPLSAAEEVTWDYLASDQSPRGHVMEQFRGLLERQGLPDAAGVSSMKHGQKVSLVGCAICRQMPGTAAGVLFMTLEDESGFANLVVWEKVFRSISHADPDQLDAGGDRTSPGGGGSGSRHRGVFLEARFCSGLCRRRTGTHRLEPRLQVAPAPRHEAREEPCGARCAASGGNGQVAPSEGAGATEVSSGIFGLLLLGPFRHHPGVRCRRPVVEAAEPLVQWDRLGAEVDREEAVMQVVEVVLVLQTLLFLGHDLVKTRMPERGGKPGVLEVEHHVDRVRGNDPVDHGDREIQQVLQRMHCQSRPRSDVDVLVMDEVDRVVHGLPVNQSVHPVEMELPPEENHDHEEHEIHRVRAKIDVGDQLVCERPEGDRLVSRPDRARADQVPENVVPHLVGEQELRVVRRKPLVGVLVLRSLPPGGVQPQVKPSRHQDQEHGIPGIDLRNPARSPVHGTIEAGREEKPADHRHGGKKQVHRPEETFRRKKVLGDMCQVPGPSEQWARFGKRIRDPFTARVALAPVCVSHDRTSAVENYGCPSVRSTEFPDGAGLVPSYDLPACGVVTSYPRYFTMASRVLSITSPGVSAT